MSARNAHHLFEEICLHLARIKICGNILPATGPVSAGGDQGRDFETFKSYIGSELNLIGNAKVSDEILVFACSIQKNYKQKIKSDIKTITQKDSSASRIYFFSGEDVIVSDRHELQKWAKKNYSINLEILDANAISLYLTEDETFWIAVEFLRISSSHYPRQDGNQDWYTNTCESWKTEKPVFYNYAEFLELKNLIRYSTENKGAFQDLSFWIERLETFGADNKHPALKRKIFYEYCWAKFKGFRTWIGLEDDLSAFFDEIPELREIPDIEDTLNLLGVCIGLSAQNQVHINATELSQWRGQLVKKIDDAIERSLTAGRKAILFYLSGFLALYADPISDYSKKEDELQLISKKRLDLAFLRWQHTLDLIKDAPLFPLDWFVDIINKLTNRRPSISSHTAYDTLTLQLDELLAERMGEIAAADKSLERANIYYDNQFYLKAIRQLHQSKIKWFTQETLEKSLSAMLTISKCYQDIGLTFAAKYYALLAAYIAGGVDNLKLRNIVQTALKVAADCDYLQGSWCGYFDLARLVLVTNKLTSEKPHDFEEDSDLKRILYHSGVIRFLIEKIDEELLHFVDTLIEKTGMRDLVDEISENIPNLWEKMAFDEIWIKLEEIIVDRPFNDLGKDRNAVWSQLGVKWKVSWENNYITTIIVEQFLAFFQLLLASFANTDLYLLKTQVKLVIHIEEVENPVLNSIPSNTESTWKLTLPIIKEDRQFLVNEHFGNNLAIITQIFLEESLLPINKFNEILENHLKEDFTLEVFLANSYTTAYQAFISKKFFDLSNRKHHNAPKIEIPFKTKENKVFFWKNSPIPEYSTKNIEKMLKFRYNRSIIPIKYTLNRLKEDKGVLEVIHRLRGIFLDWHLLTAIMVITVNYRVNQILNSSFAKSPHLYQEHFQKLINTPESESDPPVPVSEFTEKKLKDVINGNMLSSLKRFGLDLHQRTPNFKSIAHFLRERTHYWTDDIDHPDPFNLS